MEWEDYGLVSNSVDKIKSYTWQELDILSRVKLNVHLIGTSGPFIDTLPADSERDLEVVKWLKSEF